MEFQPYWVSVAATPLVIRWLLIHAQTAKARRVAGAVIFRASGLVCSYAFSCALALACVIGGWNQDARTLTTVIGTCWFLFSLWLWPATIMLDRNGITSKHIWRPTRFTPYSEVDYVTRMADREVIIYGKDNLLDIKVSQYHVGADELEAELRKRGVTYYKPLSGRQPGIV